MLTKLLNGGILRFFGGKDEKEYIACVDLACLVLPFRDLVVLRWIVPAANGMSIEHV
ncbi:hypothetical protein BDA96_01G411300 [Sorghum bicolor]|jgi:hypothetical protein|uniref:Uncharacterized protein n=1 Tax=Sorghum bicolor TaxID=4558 RepID=A0A921S468_SORBI|nr:hypothetical protein BDA96_01G411300 [Sorghum bicolor]